MLEEEERRADCGLRGVGGESTLLILSRDRCDRLDEVRFSLSIASGRRTARRRVRSRLSPVGEPMASRVSVPLSALYHRTARVWCNAQLSRGTTTTPPARSRPRWPQCRSRSAGAALTRSDDLHTKATHLLGVPASRLGRERFLCAVTAHPATQSAITDAASVLPMHGSTTRIAKFRFRAASFWAAHRRSTARSGCAASISTTTLGAN